jgi:hypothetical protein
MNIRRIRLGLKAVRELGAQQVGLYALYQFGLWSGHYRRITKPQPAPFGKQALMDTGDQTAPGELRNDWLALPNPAALAKTLGEEGQAALIAQAGEIQAGQMRRFGKAQAEELDLSLQKPLAHWTAYERISPAIDVKITWESGRFGWAYPLGRAYRISGSESYAQCFWRNTECFLASNPPNLGPHWASAQEVALRLIALVWAAKVFANSPHSSPERLTGLAQAIAQHAFRIPSTLIYARAQNNNHLLSEAAGLYTAGLALPDHPQAGHWRASGWRWFEHGLLTQIAADGNYSQHSANYQRLMLQLALWMQLLSQVDGKTFAAPALARLQAATRWLLALLDPHSGRCPNLGPNDGAYIFPLTACPYEDYRPALQAAGQVFLGHSVLGPGMWDEMSLWLKPEPAHLPDRQAHTTPRTGKQADSSEVETRGFSPAVVRAADGRSWAYLRAAQFNSRPGHADQMHVDLWRDGLNIAQDAGTYRYNAPAPWDNALTRTQVHNTLTVNGLEQMQRAGRFLYLDWAQANIDSHQAHSVSASHNGYRRLGLSHQRCLTWEANNPEQIWLIEDQLLPTRQLHDRLFQIALHWLIIDSQWQVEIAGQKGKQLALVHLLTTQGPVMLEIEALAGVQTPVQLQIVRAGELVYGSGHVDSTRGWSSPTYDDKIPALSVRFEMSGRAPIKIASRFIFGDLTFHPESTRQRGS